MYNCIVFSQAKPVEKENQIVEGSQADSLNKQIQTLQEELKKFKTRVRKSEDFIKCNEVCQQRIRLTLRLKLLRENKGTDQPYQEY